MQDLVGVGLLQRGAQSGDLRFSRCHRDSGAQPAHNTHPMEFGAGLARHVGGREQRPKENLPGIEFETARHDAEHSVSPPVEYERLPDGAWRAAEKSLPSGIMPRGFEFYPRQVLFW